MTDARGELRRVVDLGARRVVSIAVASGGRLRTIEARGTRSGIVDFDANGYVTADREYPDPLVDFALGPGEEVTVLDGNGRFAVLALSEGGVSLKASFDTGLAVRPPDCALCGQRRVLLPGELLFSTLSASRFALVDPGSARLHVADTSLQDVVARSLATPAIRRSIAEYTDAARQVALHVGPEARVARGLVVLSSTVSGSGNLLLLLSPHRPSGAVVEEFSPDGNWRRTLSCTLTGLRPDGELHRPDLVAAMAGRILLISGRQGFVAAYRVDRSV